MMISDSQFVIAAFIQNTTSNSMLTRQLPILITSNKDKIIDGSGFSLVLAYIGKESQSHLSLWRKVFNWNFHSQSIAHKRKCPIQVRATPLDITKRCGTGSSNTQIWMGPTKESKVHNLVVHINFEFVWTKSTIVPIPCSVLIKGKADHPFLSL